MDGRIYLVFPQFFFFEQMWTSKGEYGIWPCVCELTILVGHASVPQFFFLVRLMQSPVFTCYCAALPLTFIFIHVSCKKKRKVGNNRV